MARKRDLIRKVKKILNELDSKEYVFPENTNLELWYYEELKPHTLVSLELNDECNCVTLITYVDGNRETDNLSDFDNDEIEKIIENINVA